MLSNTSDFKGLLIEVVFIFHARFFGRYFSKYFGYLNYREGSLLTLRYFNCFLFVKELRYLEGDIRTFCIEARSLIVLAKETSRGAEINTN